MAITVHPNDFIIYVPQADLTPVSGTIYELDTDWFRLQLKAWEAGGNGLSEGITFLKTHNHNTEVTIAGITYARSLEILAPYSVEFEDGQYTVILTGSNNNIFDVANGILEQNQVQVIPTNSAGLITITSGSGVTEQDKLDIADRVWDETLNEANHNDPSSAGRRIVQLGDSIDGVVNDPAASVTAFITNLTESRDGFYNDQLVRFTSGNLAGLARPVLDYDGTTKTITVSEDMPEAPDDGIDFYIVPTHVHPIEEIAGGIWDEAAAGHVSAGSMGELISTLIKLTGNRVTKSGDIITIYEADEVTPWRQYDLAGGGRDQV